MRKFETIKETIEREQYLDTFCDICGESRKDWDYDNYPHHDIEISHKYGHFWPEGGCGYKLSIDICPVCFNDKLLKYLDSIAKLPIKYEEYDE